jgi:hypothetical protein
LPFNVNNLVGFAVTTGSVLIQSDGTPWRPLVHIEDISRAFLSVLHAPRELVHNEAFNVGASTENYRIREIAEMIEKVVPGSQASFAEGGGPDKRSYQVDCSKIQRVLPDFKPKWTVPLGVEELYEAYVRQGLTFDEFTGTRFLRIKRVQELQEAGLVDDELRWLVAVGASRGRAWLPRAYVLRAGVRRSRPGDSLRAGEHDLQSRTGNPARTALPEGASWRGEARAMHPRRCPRNDRGSPARVIDIPGVARR